MAEEGTYGHSEVDDAIPASSFSRSSRYAALADGKHINQSFIGSKVNVICGDHIAQQHNIVIVGQLAPNQEEKQPSESFQKIDFSELFTNEIDITTLPPVAIGQFGNVYFRNFRGQKVAIKIFTTDTEDGGGQNLLTFKRELAALRVVKHENIISFHGWGEHERFHYLVMEHLDKSLDKYVSEQNYDDNIGLSSRITWAVAKQIMHAMHYLHTREKVIVHGDLSPDNILVDTQLIIPKPKIIDFGLSRNDFQGDHSAAIQKVRNRYLPEVEEVDEVKSLEDLCKLDVYAFGLVVLFMRTGKSPFDGVASEDLYDYMRMPNKNRLRLPPYLLTTILGDIIKKCCLKKKQRPSFREIRDEFFAEGFENPFNLSEKSEFFECGFLKDTLIFVADSVVNSSKGEYHRPSERLPGYKRESLICGVEVESAPYNEGPIDEQLHELYVKHFREYQRKAKRKEIDDMPTMALDRLMINRSGPEEEQKVELKFKQKSYVHHRAMREVWRSLEPKMKELSCWCLSEVNSDYSNAFGLHVAILTNEGPGNLKKFVFTKRSSRPGVATPGSLVCGAVESCSVKDFLKRDTLSKLVPNAVEGLEYISLVDTAARGLIETLGLPLEGTDKEAITLTTIYLKFDNHDWGMCGFVDLTNDKIREENRFSFERLNHAFTSGPKDKFEHFEIYGVDFELSNMVEWIRENDVLLASTAKIVVVKVLEAFFGIASVANAFTRKM